MRTMRNLSLLLLTLAPAAALAQGKAESIVADRPGFMFSAATVGRGVVQAELGIPSITLFEFDDDSELRLTSFSGLVRFGVTDNLELRLGGPVYTEARFEVGFDDFSARDSGYGDLEVGAKWHLLDNEGGRPALALIPSVTLPTGEDGFTADDPVYQLNVAAEWTLANSWGLSALAGYLEGPESDDNQETFGVSLGRPFPGDKWSAYGEAVYVTTDFEGSDYSALVGAGVKYLARNDCQFDAYLDRGLTDGSPDWLLGLGLSFRF